MPLLEFCALLPCPCLACKRREPVDCLLPPPAAEPRGNDLKHFKNFT